MCTGFLRTSIPCNTSIVKKDSSGAHNLGNLQISTSSCFCFFFIMNCKKASSTGNGASEPSDSGASEPSRPNQLTVGQVNPVATALFDSALTGWQDPANKERDRAELKESNRKKYEAILKAEVEAIRNAEVHPKEKETVEAVQAFKAHFNASVAKEWEKFDSRYWKDPAKKESERAAMIEDNRKTFEAIEYVAAHTTGKVCNEAAEAIKLEFTATVARQWEVFDSEYKFEDRAQGVAEGKKKHARRVKKPTKPEAEQDGNKKQKIP